MVVEMNSRSAKTERRKTPCFIDKDRRKLIDRRGEDIRKIEKARRKKFEIHLKDQI